MRTKTLIAAAAILAVSLATTVAQTNVYSQNVVGYINVTITNSTLLDMIANQLDYDGTGTNNTVLTALGTNVPINTRVYVYSGGTFVSALYTSKGWSGATPTVNAAMNPGQGFFIKVPSVPTTITLVGNVLQGELQNPYAAGLQIKSSMVPQSGGLQTVLGYAPTVNDRVYRYFPAGYSSHLYTAKGWSGGEPVPEVAESFWLKAVNSGTWTRNFTVQ